MRYFLELAYHGALYHGWQKQPNAPSVQETLEHAFSTILNQPIEITGCGRTDTGVHASQYFAHFDFQGQFPHEFLRRINKFLPKDIAILQLFPVDWQQHSRFDAHYRAYRYHLSARKNVFRPDTLLYYPRATQLNKTLMTEAAALLLEYDHFAPFCKTGSDAKTMRCELYRSEWEFGEQEYIYHIAANRFLRGMVRLIVGMQLSVGLGKIKLSEVRAAMDQQTRLDKALSVPPEGLFLTEVRYPFLEEE
ncbi:MAG: tRNA pseudouridine(38-40) synthase TruA [Bacteroidetes bacterium]|nr:MAG: tRNA pseudouridine(38-40) synthase TruA [Bacteroidota bacterium]